MIVKTLRIASGQKIVTVIGGLLIAGGQTMQAMSLDSWAHDKWPFLGVLSIACTTFGGSLAVLGKGLGDSRTSDGQRTAEYQTQGPITPTAHPVPEPPR